MPGVSQLVKLIFQFEVSPHQGNLVPGAQAASPKPQAASCKPQASSVKLQALKDIIKRILDPGPRIGDRESRIKAPSSERRGPWNKFHGARTAGPDQDKCILWMGLMEGNLMW